MNPEAGNVKVFTLRTQGAHAGFLSNLRPGGHVAIHFPDVSGKLQQRLYSIIRKEAPDLFEIAVKRSGRNGVSDHLHHSFQEGSTLSLQYGAGEITVESVIDRQHIAMIAGGIGITVPIALIRELVGLSRNGRPIPDVVLLLCVPRIADIPFLHELLTLDLTTTWFTFHVFITREAVQTSDHFLPGRPSEESLHLLGQPQAVVICGSHAFAQGLEEQSAKRFPKADLLIESFTPPTAPRTAVLQQDDATSLVRLHIADSDRVLEMSPGRSLLELLESARVPIRSQCRSGVCGSCRLKVSAGECRFEPDFCLSDKDKRNGYALACCTFPLSGNITVRLNPTV
ncbi:2Fe-2S iron-sulfur cluster-binding protein [Verminephrobacter aporrectodeae]|uniref:2Fe-2S iron-sulfur cluster-binding protein n=1 Tax=Verminephrobacter aporrectodeae TaxID=1110389 RepID=UPI0002377704|nr:2Fe-2S iron-sulfur cluster-binding protein [Verminephrobacter aporrectodeae]